MKKKMVLVMCLVLSAGMVFAGGSSQNSPSADSAGGVDTFTATYIKGPYDGDPNDMRLFKDLEKETNVKVNWIVVPSSGWTERKSIMINSGDLPDVFYMNSFSNSEIDRYGTQGLFVDLTAPIKQYAPRLQSILDANPLFRVRL